MKVITQHYSADGSVVTVMVKLSLVADITALYLVLLVVEAAETCQQAQSGVLVRNSYRSYRSHSVVNKVQQSPSNTLTESRVYVPM